MKKLIIGDEIIKRLKAKCDWCGEEKTCYESVSEDNAILPKYSGLGKVIDGWHYESISGGFWGIDKLVKVIDGDWQYKSVFDTELGTVRAHICADCAKQIAKDK